MAKVVLESKNDCVALMYGLTQLTPSDLYSQCALSLSSECINIYNDNCYDLTDANGNHVHKIRISVPLSQLISITVTKYNKNKKFKDLRKLSLIVDSQEMSINVFYYKKDDKIVNNFLNMLKKYKKVKITNITCNLHEDY
ncbi:MAG: hypothetical protein ACI31G_04330 [Bacilli bacterium]